MLPVRRAMATMHLVPLVRMTSLSQCQPCRGNANDADAVSPHNGARRYPSLWNRWFPYEPVPFSPQLTPCKVTVTKDEVYNWCACGESTTQPWCDCSADECSSRGSCMCRLEREVCHDCSRPSSSHLPSWSLPSCPCLVPPPSPCLSPFSYCTSMTTSRDLSKKPWTLASRVCARTFRAQENVATLMPVKRNVRHQCLFRQLIFQFY